MNIPIIIQSFFVGGLVGLIFGFFKLPIPAPSVLAGVVGIVGIYIGYQTIQWIR